MSEEPLSREERLRCVALLCAHFARNMAYYRAARDGPDRITPMLDFWTTVDGNFIDTAVLEWCKVFAHRNEYQNWRKVVGTENHDDFEAGLLAALGMDAAALDAETSAARVYRDKFLAHLDSKRTMDIPHLNPMWAAVRFCFRHPRDLSALTLRTSDTHAFSALTSKVRAGSRIQRIYVAEE